MIGSASGSTHQTYKTQPRRLSKGDTIGLIAPSSNVLEDEEIYFARDILRSFGFKVKFASHLFDRDKSVHAIFCLRGGYGSPRILPFLDYDLIAKNPKVLIGYSDVTALLNAIYARTGLITFHGPIARQNFTEYTVESFKKVLFQANKNIELATPPLFEVTEGQAEKEKSWQSLRKINWW